MELPRRGAGSLTKLTTPSGKRLRTPQEFIQKCLDAGHPCCKVKIYNNKEKIIVEALKNMKTKHTHILKVRRPTGREEDEFKSMIIRDQISSGKEAQQQVEVIMGGDEYVKKELKSSKR